MAIEVSFNSLAHSHLSHAEFFAKNVLPMAKDGKTPIVQRVEWDPGEDEKNISGAMDGGRNRSRADSVYYGVGDSRGGSVAPVREDSQSELRTLFRGQ